MNVTSFLDHSDPLMSKVLNIEQSFTVFKIPQTPLLGFNHFLQIYLFTLCKLFSAGRWWRRETRWGGGCGSNEGSRVTTCRASHWEDCRKTQRSATITQKRAGETQNSHHSNPKASVTTGGHYQENNVSPEILQSSHLLNIAVTPHTWSSAFITVRWLSASSVFDLSPTIELQGS